MTKFVSLTVALLATGTLCQSAQASTYIVERTVSPYVSCYSKQYVPAQVRINTRGKLVRGTQQYWQTSDQTWNLVRDPSVYIQTEHVVEADHYTLIPTGCPDPVAARPGRASALPNAPGRRIGPRPPGRSDGVTPFTDLAFVAFRA